MKLLSANPSLFKSSILVGFLALSGCQHSNPILPESLPFLIRTGYTSLYSSPSSKRIRWREFKNLDSDEAKNKIHGRMEAIEAFKTAEPDPYTGKSNMPKACLKENLPPNKFIETQSELATSLHLYSSENFVLGVCSEKERIKTQQVLLYCKSSRTLFIVSVFLESHMDWPSEAIVTCLP